MSAPVAHAIATTTNPAITMNFRIRTSRTPSNIDTDLITVCASRALARDFTAKCIGLATWVFTL